VIEETYCIQFVLKCYTHCINRARWHRCLRSDGLRVGGNRSDRRKPTCL